MMINWEEMSHNIQTPKKISDRIILERYYAMIDDYIYNELINIDLEKYLGYYGFTLEEIKQEE